MPRRLWTPPDVPFTLPTSGASKGALYASVQRGRTKVLLPGVFISAQAWPDEPIQQHLIMALARQLRWPHLMASHHTGALACGLPLLHPARAAEQPPRFTRAPGPGVRSSVEPRVTVRELPLEALTDLPSGAARGLQFTTPARTAVDLACELPLPEALMLTDYVARQALMGLRGRRTNGDDGDAPATSGRGELSRVARQAAMRPLELAVVAAVHRRPGVRQALEFTDPLRDSPPESFSFGAFVLAGLPLPQCQVLFDSEGQIIRVDFYWPEFGLVGECDGNVKYDGTYGLAAEALVGQNVREQALRDMGLSVVRWTAAEIFLRPDAVINRIASRLMGCGWDGRLRR